MNPRNAALMAMAKAAGQMPAGAIDYVLVDGNAELDEEEVPFPSDRCVPIQHAFLSVPIPCPDF
eukprot:scaffold77552_cov16-Tisochrysis_lutea.AAC.1